MNLYLAQNSPPATGGGEPPAMGGGLKVPSEQLNNFESNLNNQLQNLLTSEALPLLGVIAICSALAVMKK